MEPESGCRNSPIWLIGDSPPDRWKDCLSEPLDPRHPARHSIWTPIIDGIQERAFRRDRLRLDTCRIHIRNAVLDRSHKDMAKGRDWSGLKHDTEELGRLLNKYRPRLVLTFGHSPMSSRREASREARTGPTAIGAPSGSGRSLGVVSKPILRATSHCFRYCT